MKNEKLKMINETAVALFSIFNLQFLIYN